MHTYIFLFFYFSYFFYFFIFYFLLNFLGWAQLSPHGLDWTQPAQPGHWPKPVTRLGKGTHHACVHWKRLINLTASVQG
jgi:hypothetical protein